MKKVILMSACLIGLSVGARAQVSSGDTLVVEHPDRVVIINTDDAMSIHVQGQEGNPDYDYRRTHSVRADDVNVTTERRVADVSFRLPFQQSSVPDDKKNAVEFGILSRLWVGALVPTNVSSNLNLNASLEGGVEILGVHIYPRQSKWSFATGIQCQVRDFFVGKHDCLLMNGDEMIVAPYPITSGQRHSTIEVLSLGIPLLACYQFSPKIDAFAGAVLNFNGWGTLDVSYKFNGHTLSQEDHDIYQRKLTVDFMAGLRIWEYLGFYVSYSPADVISKGHGPLFRSFTIGTQIFL